MIPTMLFCVLFAFCTIASGEVLIGTERCTWGPNYWCNDASSAKECNAVEHCVQKVWRKEPTFENLVKAYSAQAKEGIVCELCEVGVEELMEYVKANATTNMDQLVNKYICTRFGGLSDMCNAVFDKEIDRLVAALDSGMGADKCCMLFGFCSKQKMIELVPAKKINQEPLGKRECTWGPSYWCSDAMKARKCNTVDHCVASWKKSPTSDNLRKVHQAVTGGDLCVDCEAAVQKLVNYVTADTTDKEIEQYIDENLCASLGPLQDTCKQLIAQELPEIVKQLRANVHPQQLCATLGLCTAKLSAAKEEIKAPKSKVKGTPQCTMCTLVMKEFEDYVSSNNTETEIEAALDRVCSILPGSISGECREFVDEYLPGIINLVALEVPPALICTFLQLCAGSKESVGDSTECEMCEMAVKYIESQLRNNQTENVILDDLEKLCHILPKSTQSECISLMNEYAPLIIQLLVSELDPSQVCQELGLCKSKQKLVGEKRCTQGPSYWCINRDTAIECNAVDHCKDHVWN